MDYLTHIRRETDAFLEAAVAGPSGTEVPTCPGWTMRRLIGHLGQVQRHHGTHLARGVTDPPDARRERAPDDDDLLIDWFRQSHQIMLDNLTGVPPDTPAWNFSTAADDKTVAFWHRRMAHEALVHRWDAEHARGGAGPIDTDLALDGVAEFLSVFLPRFRSEDDPEGTVTLIADEDREYRSRWGDGGAAATVRGPAADLLLVVWGRTGLSEVDVEGDQALVASIINR